MKPSFGCLLCKQRRKQKTEPKRETSDAVITIILKEDSFKFKLLSFLWEKFFSEIDFCLGKRAK